MNSGTGRVSGKYAVWVMAVIVVAMFTGGLVLALRLAPAADRWRDGELTPTTGR